MKIHGTAKGAALSTKDFGVAFSGVTPAVQTCQGESYSGENIGVGVAYPSGTVTMCGMIPRSGNTLIGKVANKFSLLMRLQGSITDLEVGAKIYNDSNVHQATSTNTIDDVASDAYNFRQFEFASEFTVTEGYFYVLYGVSGTFDNTNRVNIQMDANPADNNSLGYYSDTWYDSWFGTYKPVSICFT